MLTTSPDVGLAEMAARYQANPRLTVPATAFDRALKCADEVS